MEVRHALADDVVHGDERPVRLHALLDRSGQPLGVAEQLADERTREVADRHVVVPRQEQRVAGEDGPGVEKAQGVGVLENDVCRSLAGDNVAEEAAGLPQCRLKHQGGELRVSFGVASGQ